MNTLKAVPLLLGGLDLLGYEEIRQIGKVGSQLYGIEQAARAVLGS